MRTGHGLGKYAVAQSTETGKIQSNKRKEKMTRQTHENVVEEVQA